jgi:CubicO group peptidase (beta-lactamase class C family)
MPGNFNPPDTAHPYRHYTSEALYAFLSAHMLRRLPGERYEYSNLGTGLLAHALGLRAKHTYASLLRTRITRPLGLAFTHLTVPRAAEARVAPPHTADGTATEPWDFATLTGAGAIRSTVHDMLVFARANLRPDDTPLGKALEVAQRIHWKPTAGAGPRMGLGWHAGADKTRWHNGQTGGYHSYLWIDPAANRAVVVLSNTATGQVDRLGQSIADLLQGKAVTPPTFPVPVDLTAAQLGACVGTYEIAPQFKVVVTLEDGKLMAQATGQSKLRLWPKSATEFFLRVIKARVTFEQDDQGTAVALVLHQNGQQMRGKKTD